MREAKGRGVGGGGGGGFLRCGFDLPMWLLPRGSFFKPREFLSRRDASGHTPYFPDHPIDSKPARRNIVVKKRRNKIKARHAIHACTHTHTPTGFRSPYTARLPLLPPPFGLPFRSPSSLLSHPHRLIGRVPPAEGGRYSNMRSEPSPFNIADRGTNEYSLNTFFRF